MDDWLSVPEFAKLVGKSPQAVYKRYNTLESTLRRTENGRKLIKREAEVLFKEMDLEALNKRMDALVSENEKLTASNQALSHEVELLKVHNEELIKRIESFEALTSDLNDRLKEANLLHLNAQKALENAIMKPSEPIKQLPLFTRIKIWLNGSESSERAE